MRSGKNDRARGKADSFGGRVLEFISKLTGNKKTAAKGKAARGRGKYRSVKGQAKS